MRRLHRGGEGQYLVNGSPVRRTDLVELLADVGLGGGMHSIIGQGKVEEILGSKPGGAARAVEEAAGLGKFKRRRHRAELKLARVAVEVERARDVEAEVQKRLRPLALQATAAERAEKLARRDRPLAARIAALELAEVDGRAAGVDERRDGSGARAERRRRASSRRCCRAQPGRGGAGRRRRQARGGDRGALPAARARPTGWSCAVSAAETPGELLRAELPATRAEGRRAALDRARRAAERARRARRAQARLAASGSPRSSASLAEREGLPPAARALAEEGERLALSLLDVDAGQRARGRRGARQARAGRSSRTMRKRRWRCSSARVRRARPLGARATDACRPVTAARGRRAAGALRRRARRRRLSQELLVLERLRKVARSRGHARGLRLRPGAGRALVRGRDGRGGAARARGAAARARGRARASSERPARSGARRRRRPRRRSRSGRRRGLDAARAPRSRSAWSRRSPRGRADAARLEAPLRAAPTRAAAAARAAGSCASSAPTRPSCAAQPAEARRALVGGRRRARAPRRRGRRGSAALRGSGRRAGRRATTADELAAKLERLERRREALGSVNPLAKEEYEREKERLDELGDAARGPRAEPRRAREAARTS